MTIEKANSNDHEVLTDITKKSKAYWGYSANQIEAWSNLLTITETYIENKSVYKLVIDNEIAGYYAFFSEDDQTIKLDNLFILPKYIGKGFGKMLMNDLFLKAKTTAANRILLDAEPYAEKFYVKLGFVKIGKIETSIRDRYLPVMELNIHIY
ncbi:MAG: GNAT family N-acetyltransferase [Flavobacterium psychrophilum]|nr:MAG: GNAT family N-acetyltransferase [Flavobacterium psychrophilum]